MLSDGTLHYSTANSLEKEFLLFVNMSVSTTLINKRHGNANVSIKTGKHGFCITSTYLLSISALPLVSPILLVQLLLRLLLLISTTLGAGYSFAPHHGLYNDGSQSRCALSSTTLHHR